MAKNYSQKKYNEYLSKFELLNNEQLILLALAGLLNEKEYADESALRRLMIERANTIDKQNIILDNVTVT